MATSASSEPPRRVDAFPDDISIDSESDDHVSSADYDYDEGDGHELDDTDDELHDDREDGFDDSEDGFVYRPSVIEKPHATHESEQLVADVEDALPSSDQYDDVSILTQTQERFDVMPSRVPFPAKRPLSYSSSTTLHSSPSIARRPHIPQVPLHVLAYNVLVFAVQVLLLCIRTFQSVTTKAYASPFVQKRVIPFLDRLILNKLREKRDSAWVYSIGKLQQIRNLTISDIVAWVRETRKGAIRTYVYWRDFDYKAYFTPPPKPPPPPRPPAKPLGEVLRELKVLAADRVALLKKTREYVLVSWICCKLWILTVNFGIWLWSNTASLRSTRFAKAIASNTLYISKTIFATAMSGLKSNYLKVVAHQIKSKAHIYAMTLLKLGVSVTPLMLIFYSARLCQHRVELQSLENSAQWLLPSKLLADLHSEWSWIIRLHTGMYAFLATLFICSTAWVYLPVVKNSKIFVASSFSRQISLLLSPKHSNVQKATVIGILVSTTLLTLLLEGSVSEEFNRVDQIYLLPEWTLLNSTIATVSQYRLPHNPLVSRSDICSLEIEVDRDFRFAAVICRRRGVCVCPVRDVTNCTLVKYQKQTGAKKAQQPMQFWTVALSCPQPNFTLPTPISVLWHTLEGAAMPQAPALVPIPKHIAFDRSSLTIGFTQPVISKHVLLDVGNLTITQVVQATLKANTSAVVPIPQAFRGWYSNLSISISAIDTACIGANGVKCDKAVMVSVPVKSPGISIDYGKDYPIHFTALVGRRECKESSIFVEFSVPVIFRESSTSSFEMVFYDTTRGGSSKIWISNVDIKIANRAFCVDVNGIGPRSGSLKISATEFLSGKSWPYLKVSKDPVSVDIIGETLTVSVLPQVQATAKALLGLYLSEIHSEFGLKVIWSKGLSCPPKYNLRTDTHPQIRGMPIQPGLYSVQQYCSLSPKAKPAFDSVLVRYVDIKSAPPSLNIVSASFDSGNIYLSFNFSTAIQEISIPIESIRVKIGHKGHDTIVFPLAVDSGKFNDTVHYNGIEWMLVFPTQHFINKSSSYEISLELVGTSGVLRKPWNIWTSISRRARTWFSVLYFSGNDGSYGLADTNGWSCKDATPPFAQCAVTHATAELYPHQPRITAVERAGESVDLQTALQTAVGLFFVRVQFSAPVSTRSGAAWSSGDFTVTLQTDKSDQAKSTNIDVVTVTADTHKESAVILGVRATDLVKPFTFARISVPQGKILGFGRGRKNSAAYVSSNAFFVDIESILNADHRVWRVTDAVVEGQKNNSKPSVLQTVLYLAGMAVLCVTVLCVAVWHTMRRILDGLVVTCEGV
ncbi:hypothetical protein HDU84_003857 [Entophlyctis sp. JEL0112]|nr:hypothetical protein HDU84_003857 [Entophlyctis sp. JEL0112]